MEFYNTFKYQFELLPRFTIIYKKQVEDTPLDTGIAFEWLWFGVFINIK